MASDARFIKRRAILPPTIDVASQAIAHIFRMSVSDVGKQKKDFYMSFDQEVFATLYLSDRNESLRESNDYNDDIPHGAVKQTKNKTMPQIVITATVLRYCG